MTIGFHALAAALMLLPSAAVWVAWPRRRRASWIAVAGALAVSIGLIHVVGVYVSVPLFLIYYIRFLGRHSWFLTLSISLATPVVTFLFFDIALRIVLPKGYTEPLFYPLYDILL